MPQSQCVILGIEGSLIRDSPESPCNALNKTLYPLISTGLTNVQT